MLIIIKANFIFFEAKLLCDIVEYFFMLLKRPNIYCLKSV